MRPRSTSFAVIDLPRYLFLVGGWTPPQAFVHIWYSVLHAGPA
jgi:hypothetical protein